MQPNREFPGLGLTGACSPHCRGVFVAGVIVGLSGCGQSPVTKDKESIRTIPLPGEDRVSVNPAEMDAARPLVAGSTRDEPLTAEELAHRNRLEAELADRVTRARKAGQLLPLKTLLNHRDSSGFFALGEGNIELAYAQSWALVYMLMQDDSRARFFDYVKSYRDICNDRAAVAVEKAEPETLLETQLQTDFSSLERKWNSFITHM